MHNKEIEAFAYGGAGNQCRHFTEKNAVSIKMQVHKSNEIALHLYQANGFTVKEISPWDRDFVIMEKKL